MNLSFRLAGLYFIINLYAFPLQIGASASVISTKDNFLLMECEPVANTGKPKWEKVTASQVNEIHKVLRTAFNQARRWKLIKENPFLDTDVPEHKSKERPAFSPNEFEKILEYTDVPEDYDRYVIHVALEQSSIVQQMEDDYLKVDDESVTPDKEVLLQFIAEHPELITELLSAKK